MTRDRPAMPPSAVPDVEWGLLMQASQGGDRIAYQQLLRLVASWLKRYHTGRLPPSMVDDAVQDTLLAIHEKRHTYDPEKPFKPWLSAIARHKWIDRLRSMQLRRTELLDEEISVEGHENAVVTNMSLAALLQELKPAQSQVIRLVKLQGFSVDEAASLTGQSVSLVKVNVHRGLRRLAILVQRRSDDD